MRNLVIVLTVVVLVACAQTEYKTLETRAPTIYDGRGGTKQVIDGMDFWDNGEPPRRFLVIGFVEDKRREAPGLMLMLRGDVVRKARSAGGDAVIQVGSSSRLVGISSFSTASATAYGNQASGYGLGFAQRISDHSSRYAVVRYVDSADAGAPVAAPAAPIGLSPAPSLTSPAARPFVPSAGLIEQPVRQIGGLPAPDQSGPDKFAAQEYARKSGCNSQPVAMLAMRTPGIETYSIACANGGQLLLQCQYGNCRAMQ